MCDEVVIGCAGVEEADGEGRVERERERERVARVI